MDNKGKRYIDCAAATFNLSLGYSNAEVLEAVEKQAHNLVHLTSSYMSEPVRKLVEKLKELTYYFENTVENPFLKYRID